MGATPTGCAAGLAIALTIAAHGDARAQTAKPDCSAGLISSFYKEQPQHSKWQGDDQFVCNFTGGRGVAITISYRCPDNQDSWDGVTVFRRTKKDTVFWSDTEVIARKKGTVSGYSGTFEGNERMWLRINKQTMATVYVMTNDFGHATDFRDAARALADANRPPASVLGCDATDPLPGGAAAGADAAVLDAAPADARAGGADARVIDAAETDACRLEGGVTDHRGVGVPGVHVQLRYGSLRQDVATDSRGRYAFEPIADSPPDFDAAADRVRVVVKFQDRGRTPGRFRVRYEASLAFLASDAFLLTDPDACAPRDFDARAIPDAYPDMGVAKEHWADIMQIYQSMLDAWELGRQLVGDQLDYELPLTVSAFCGVFGCKDHYAATRTRPSFSNEPVSPRIFFGDATSLRTDNNWPDNREYHEFGHFFLADAFGNAQPAFRGNDNHEGYYVNRSSEDAWGEGWAEFFAMMVNKHVRRRPRPELYLCQGYIGNLELDYPAWSYDGKAEELAVAGILLDFEDGPADYAAPKPSARVKVLWHAPWRDRSHGLLIVGRVANFTHVETAEQVMVVAELTKDGKRVHVGVAPAMPMDIPSDMSGWFVIPVPEVDYDEIGMGVYEGRAGGVVTDDDPIDVTLSDLWWAIRTFRSGHPQSNGYLFDVSDLYAALRSRFGGGDADANGIEDVDQIFISHGYFADADGDWTYRPGDTVGLSSHPGMVPRQFLPAALQQMARVDTGDVDAAIYVHVGFPAPHEGHSYGYLVHPDADGRVPVSVPPLGREGTVTLVVVADGFEPLIAGSISTADYWKQARAAGSGAFLSFSADLQRGTITHGAARRSSRAKLLLAAGAAVALLALVLVAIGRRRRVLVVSGAVLVVMAGAAIVAGAILPRRHADTLSFESARPPAVTPVYTAFGAAAIDDSAGEVEPDL